MTLRRVRPVLDTIPEPTRYRDDGCDLHPACLSCPFAVCRYDLPGGGSPDREAVRLQIQETFASEGPSATELARRFKVSKRTVHRILQKQRERARL